MRRKWPLVLISGVSLFFGLTLILGRLWLLPELQNRLEDRLASWMESQQLHFRYEGLRIRWYGLSLQHVSLKGQGIEAKGGLEVHVRLWPDLHFGQPERVIFKAWKVEWSRQLPQASGSAEAAARSDQKSASGPARAVKYLQAWLGSLPQTGLVLTLEDLSLKVRDSAARPLLEMPHIDLSYSTAEQVLQVHVHSLRYRQQELLRGIEGQIILKAQGGERLPFLLTALDRGDIPWQLQGSISQDFDGLELRHKRKGLPPSWRPYFPWLQPQDALQILVKLSVDGLIERDKLAFDVQLVSSNLHLNHHLLGDVPWGPFPFSIRTKGHLSAETGALKLQSGMAHLAASRRHAPVRIYFQGQKNDLLAPMAEEPLLLSLSMPETPCQILLDAWPEHAFPLLNGFALQGSVGGQARLQLLKSDASALQLGPHSLNCSLRETPERFSRNWLKQAPASGDHSLRSKGIEAQELKDQAALVALFSPHFVALPQISSDFLHALISAEDGGFWRHEGFSLNALLAALQANLKAGRVVYGGSTLTMQLVKNLYLSREKVLSRKVQELFLAWAIEQVLRKEEILEIYANIVEYGPGLRGIGPASQAYFSKHPRDLLRSEAVFLASIMPSPYRYFHANYCEGRLGDALLERMQKTALGASVLSKQANWLGEYARELRGFTFTSGAEASCKGRLNLSKSRARPAGLKEF